MSAILSQEADHSISDLPDRTASAGKAVFKSEWHDAKEIVVPFDRGAFSNTFVSEKDFAAAYAPNRARPPVGGLRMETGRTVGRIVHAPNLLQTLGSAAGSFPGIFEKLLMAWTPALLIVAFPLSRWSSMISAGAWIAILWIFWRFYSRSTVSWLVWTSGILVTLAWVYDAPLTAYFFHA